MTSDTEQAKIDKNSAATYDLKKDGLLDSLIRSVRCRIRSRLVRDAWWIATW